MELDWDSILTGCSFLIIFIIFILIELANLIEFTHLIVFIHFLFTITPVLFLLIHPNFYHIQPFNFIYSHFLSIFLSTIFLLTSYLSILHYHLLLLSKYPLYLSTHSLITFMYLIILHLNISIILLYAIIIHHSLISLYFTLISLIILSILSLNLRKLIFASIEVDQP